VQTPYHALGVPKLSDRDARTSVSVDLVHPLFLLFDAKAVFSHHSDHDAHVTELQSSKVDAQALCLFSPTRGGPQACHLVLRLPTARVPVSFASTSRKAEDTKDDFALMCGRGAGPAEPSLELQSLLLPSLLTPERSQTESSWCS
jgi:hypothetical protein